MLCKSCVGRCREIITAEMPLEIECPMCGGDGCSECEDGQYTVDQCPSRYIGSELIGDIEIVIASKDHLPVAGGLLDQSAWWFELRQRLQAEENRIESDRAKEK